MQKKETLWELLKRLDEEAGQFNSHIHKANQYFDKASDSTGKLLKEHERQLHRTIVKVRSAIRSFMKDNKGSKPKE
jgi:hypothetical protein